MNNDIEMITKAAIAVLQGKVQCESCYWYMPRVLEDPSFAIRIEMMMEEEEETTLPKYYQNGCVIRGMNDIRRKNGIWIVDEEPQPPRQPDPIIWRICKHFICANTVMEGGGGVAFGLWRYQSKYSKIPSSEIGIVDER